MAIETQQGKGLAWHVYNLGSRKDFPVNTQGITAYLAELRSGSIDFAEEGQRYLDAYKVIYHNSEYRHELKNDKAYKQDTEVRNDYPIMKPFRSQRKEPRVGYDPVADES